MVRKEGMEVEGGGLDRALGNDRKHEMKISTGEIKVYVIELKRPVK